MQNAIHETVVSDVFEMIKDGINAGKDVIDPRDKRLLRSSSLAKATAGLTAVFPVCCTDTLPIETASMVAKAIERKNVSMLQMAFSAFNITNATDAVTHMAKFHKNLDMSKMDLDKFMDMMESLEESTAMVERSKVSAVIEDCKRNINFVLDNEVNPTSLLEFSEVNNYGRQVVIQEAPRPQVLDKTTGKIRYANDDELYSDLYSADKTTRDNARWFYQQQNKEDEYNKSLRQKELDRLAAGERDRNQNAQRELDRKTAEDRDKERNAIDRAKLDVDIQKNNNDARKALGTASDQKRQYLSAQLLQSDVKKANEMQPSMIIVNFYVNDKDRDLNVAQQAVVGVKSKLYAISSSDILNKIITKHIDNDIILKLVKVSTREISFIKDFLLGIDDAKLDSLSKSRKGSGSRIFKALERRAIKGKIRKSLRMNNSAKAITSLVISSEEVEELRKYENIDVMQPRVICPIMEKLNLLYFVVVDETAESINIMTDGDTAYETYSFTSLEREAGDGAYKKVVNLITKMS